MRRRNRRQFFNEEKETKKIVIISLSVLIIAVVAFIITFLIYNNFLDKNIEMAKANKSSITELMNINEQSSSQASSSIGKSVNEIKGENEQTNGEQKNVEVNKIAINTSNMEKETKENTIKANETQENVVKQPEVKKEEKVPDPTFIKPVEGEISVEFAKDTLIYSNTLKEWVTHMGVDIKADKATVVKASAEGTVKSIKNDPRYGITVVVEHVNGFETIYSNLLTAEFVSEGENVKKGQTLGTVGNTATFEIADASHLHFEIQKNDTNLDPTLYIK